MVDAVPFLLQIVEVILHRVVNNYLLGVQIAVEVLVPNPQSAALHVEQYGVKPLCVERQHITLSITLLSLFNI